MDSQSKNYFSNIKRLDYRFMKTIIICLAVLGLRYQIVFFKLHIRFGFYILISFESKSVIKSTSVIIFHNHEGVWSRTLGF